MKRTQIQLPNPLYEAALQVAKNREISMTELVRRGLEYMIAVSPVLENSVEKKWELPTPQPLGAKDPFANENWRYDLHLRPEFVAEDESSYGEKD